MRNRCAVSIARPCRGSPTSSPIPSHPVSTNYSQLNNTRGNEHGSTISLSRPGCCSAQYFSPSKPFAHHFQIIDQSSLYTRFHTPRVWPYNIIRQHRVALSCRDYSNAHLRGPKPSPTRILRATQSLERHGPRTTCQRRVRYTLSKHRPHKDNRKHP